MKLFILGIAMNLNSSEDCISMAIERVDDEFDGCEIKHHVKRFTELAFLMKEVLQNHEDEH
jgi:hypothetical protein